MNRISKNWKTVILIIIAIILVITALSLCIVKYYSLTTYNGLDKESPAYYAIKNFERRGSSVAPYHGRFLYNLIVDNNFKRGLEIGTSTGYSALWMGYAFKETGGILVTIEIDTLKAEIAINNLMEAGLESIVDCRLNDAYKEIPDLEGKFDFAFIDAGNYIKFYGMIKPRMNKNGIIATHNMLSHYKNRKKFRKFLRKDKGSSSAIHWLRDISVTIIQDPYSSSY